MNELLNWIIAVAVIAPLETSLSEKLEAARVPPAAIEQVRHCASSAVPSIAERAYADPAWAAQSIVGIWMGSRSPEEALIAVAPSCAPAVKAIREYRHPRDAAQKEL